MSQPGHRPHSKRRPAEWAVLMLAGTAVAIPVACLATLLWDPLADGLSRLSWTFVLSPPSGGAETTGILSGILGSMYLVLLTAAIALPLGVGAAVHLEELGGRNRLSALFEINTASLAGVPSIVHGLLGLAVFVRTLGLGRSLIAGACTLSLLVLPMIVVVSRQALRAVPRGLREASLSLGATRLQTVRMVVMPAAFPTILTGVMRVMARVLGETAPLLVIGALSHATVVPDALDAPLTALPVQIFDWLSRPEPGFIATAAAGIVVLMAAILSLTATAIYLRHRHERRSERS